MGVYDEYGYLGLQIKIGAEGNRYKVGDVVPLPDGLVFGYEGVAIVEQSELVAVYPYDQMWDKWGGWIGAEFKSVIKGSNPIKSAVDVLVERIDDTVKEVEQN